MDFLSKMHCLKVKALQSRILLIPSRSIAMCSAVSPQLLKSMRLTLVVSRCSQAWARPLTWALLSL